MGVCLRPGCENDVAGHHAPAGDVALHAAVRAAVTRKLCARRRHVCGRRVKSSCQISCKVWCGAPAQTPCAERGNLPMRRPSTGAANRGTAARLRVPRGATAGGKACRHTRARGAPRPAPEYSRPLPRRTPSAAHALRFPRKSSKRRPKRVPDARAAPGAESGNLPMGQVSAGVGVPSGAADAFSGDTDNLPLATHRLGTALGQRFCAFAYLSERKNRSDSGPFMCRKRAVHVPPTCRPRPARAPPMRRSHTAHAPPMCRGA